MQNEWDFKNYLFLGLGLIGGSVARAIREIQPDAVITAYVRHPEKLKSALDTGVINALTDTPTSGASEADVILLCAPTLTNIENLKLIAPYLRKSTLITDVGSVKQDIQKAADELGLSGQFLGGHPMTGKEQSGYLSADPKILKNACYILTPSASTAPKDTEAFSALARAMGSRVLITDPAYHDTAVAAVSHLPHLIAASLVDLVKDTDNEEAFLKTIAAGGFRDITRIASSDPAVWSSICESNRDNIRLLLSAYIDRLTAIDHALENDDYGAIRNLFDTAGRYRASMNTHEE